MQVSRLVAVAALTMVAATGCTDQQARDQIAALTTQLDAVTKDFQQYKDWLGKSEQPKQPADKTVHAWHTSVFEAICSLEDKVKPPVNKRLCHTEGDHGSAPHPPPFE